MDDLHYESALRATSPIYRAVVRVLNAEINYPVRIQIMRLDALPSGQIAYGYLCDHVNGILRESLDSGRLSATHDEGPFVWESNTGLRMAWVVRLRRDGERDAEIVIA